MNKYNTIHISDEYNNFTFLSKNREPKQSKAEYKKLKKSIETYGLLSPIIVDDDYTVAEGQHRLLICQELNIPIEFIIRPGVAKRIIELNNDRKNWKVTDYIKYYNSKPSYRLLEEIMKELSLSANTVHAILKGKEINKNEFYEGNFSIQKKDMIKYKRVKNKLMEIIHAQNGKFKGALKRARVVPQLVKLITTNNYNHSYFLNKLETKVVILPSVNRGEDARIMLSECYNKGLGKKKHINFG